MKKERKRHRQGKSVSRVEHLFIKEERMIDPYVIEQQEVEEEEEEEEKPCQ